MITVTLQYELQGDGAAVCVITLDAGQGDEVWLHTSPLRRARSGRLETPGVEGVTVSHPPSHTAPCAAYDSDRQQHVWQGRVEDRRMLTIAATRAGALFGWVAVQYEHGQFSVWEAGQLSIDLINFQAERLPSSPRPEPFHASAAGSTSGEDDWHRVARAYIKERRVEEVLALFEQRAGRYAAGMAQHEAEVFRLIGCFLAVQGHLAQALCAFDLVLGEQPSNVEVLLAKGIVLLELERYAGARLVFQAAVSLDGGRAEAWELLADALLLADGSLAAALEAYERAIALNPGLASAHHGKGNALSRLGRMAQAHDAYAYAVRLDPFDPCFRESLRVVRAEYSAALLELTAGQHSWEMRISPLQQLVSRPGGRKPGEDVCLISLDDVQPPIRQAPRLQRDEELDALVRALLELHHRRIALPWHPIRALRYGLAAAQFKDITRRHDRKTQRPPGRAQADAGWWNHVPAGAHRLRPPVLFGLAILALALVSLGRLRLGHRHTRLRYPGRHEKG